MHTIQSKFNCDERSGQALWEPTEMIATGGFRVVI